MLSNFPRIFVFKIRVLCTKTVFNFKIHPNQPKPFKNIIEDKHYKYITKNAITNQLWDYFISLSIISKKYNYQTESINEKKTVSDQVDIGLCIKLKLSRLFIFIILLGFVCCNLNEKEKRIHTTNRFFHFKF